MNTQAAATSDPSTTPKQQEQVADAVRLADLWLDEATDFDSGVTSTAAWSRAEWIVGATDVWKGLVEPISASSVNSLASAMPGDAQSMGGPLLGMLQRAIGAMLAQQIGSGLGALAGEVLTASDIGLPLGAQGLAALVPANVKEFASYHLPERSFIYLLHALRDGGVSPSKIVSTPDWKMFLMRPGDVERELLRLHQFKKLEYHVAGSLVQLDLPCPNARDYARRMLA